MTAVLVLYGYQKPQFWANFDICRYRTDPLLPTRVKFDVLEQTQGLHVSLYAKCRLLL